MKDLVAYFSATGITKDIAKTLADVANADIYEILPKEPYS
ncbi:flavodoxin, partial [uncultured Helicobacter sp.]